MKIAKMNTLDNVIRTVLKDKKGMYINYKNKKWYIKPDTDFSKAFIIDYMIWKEVK